MSGEEITALGTMKALAEALGDRPGALLPLGYCPQTRVFEALFVENNRVLAAGVHANLHDCLKGLIEEVSAL